MAKKRTRARLILICAMLRILVLNSPITHRYHRCFQDHSHPYPLDIRKGCTSPLPCWSRFHTRGTGWHSAVVGQNCRRSEKRAGNNQHASCAHTEALPVIEKEGRTRLSHVQVATKGVNCTRSMACRLVLQHAIIERMDASHMWRTWSRE